MPTPTTLTTIYQFASDSPWLAFFLAVTLASLLRGLAYLITVAIRGWPAPNTYTGENDED